MDTSLRCPADRTSLLYDTACLQIENRLDFPVDLFTASSACYQCDETYWATVPLHANLSLVVSAVHNISISAVPQGGGDSLCPISILFKQHEVVSWDIKDCSLTIQEKGDNAFLPLFFFAAWVASLLLVLSVSRTVYRSRWIWNLCRRDPTIIDLQNDLGNPSVSSDSLPLVQSELVPLRRLSGPRINSLDTFRGLTIALMIFVNYGGGKYWFFEHSAWNGVTIADFVFPWFAWLMGASLVMSVRSKLRSCATRCAVLQSSLRRAATLVVLGLLVNMFGQNDLSTARFCGVLQRLGVAYLVVCALEVAFMKIQPRFNVRRWWLPAELVESWQQWFIVLLLVAVHTVVTLRLAVPGCPTGYLGPGGAGNHSSTPLCTGGATRYIDTMLFSDNHLYNRGPVKRVYHTTVPFDPEGILGTLTTCLTVYLGVVACNIMLCYNTTRQRCTHWLVWALLTGVAAGSLCGWSQETGLIPVNKQLWSLSFSLLTASSAFLLFSILFMVVDHFSWWGGEPFRYAGMNAILLYIGHIVTRHTFPWSWKPYSLANHNELFAMNVIGVVLWLLIAKVLHRHEIFVSV